MELSLLLGKVLAACFVVVGVSCFFYAKTFEHMASKLSKRPTLMMLGGLGSLIIGLFMVLGHNVWEASWVVVVTIVGWIALIKGVLLFWFPKFMVGLVRAIANPLFYRFSGVILFLVGLYLGYMAFWS